MTMSMDASMLNIVYLKLGTNSNPLNA